jgi:hypothetical protein
MNDDLRKFLDRAERNRMDELYIARRVASSNESAAIRSAEELDRKNAHLRQLQGEIDGLRAELERVKQIARARLDKIHELQLELAQIEDDPRRLEDHGGLWGAECRGELDE